MKSLLLMFTAIAVIGGTEPTDYKTAYENAQNGDKPLLVLVTADWCPPCQTMKSTTIPRLVSKDAFKEFHYATVDLGKDEKLARKLIGNRGVPQLILFEKNDTRWERRYLRGIQTVESVEAFISRSQMRTRTAKNFTSKSK